MKLKKVFGIVAGGFLFFFGIVFAMAAVFQPLRLIVAALLFVSGFIVVYYVTRKPKTIIQKVELSGQMKTVPLKCPHCSASLDTTQIQVVAGVPYATCPYCSQTFEITEEPKW